MSPKTTFMTPADITGEPEIKIAAPTVSSVLGTSKAGYLISEQLNQTESFKLATDY